MWQLASLYYMNRVQDLPPSVVQLLPSAVAQQLPAGSTDVHALKSMDRSGEQGVALVMALLMVLAVSVLTSSLVMVARAKRCPA